MTRSLGAEIQSVLTHVLGWYRTLIITNRMKAGSLQKGTGPSAQVSKSPRAVPGLGACPSLRIADSALGTHDLIFSTLFTVDTAPLRAHHQLIRMHHGLEFQAVLASC